MRRDDMDLLENIARLKFGPCSIWMIFSGRRHLTTYGTPCISFFLVNVQFKCALLFGTGTETISFNHPTNMMLEPQNVTHKSS